MSNRPLITFGYGSRSRDEAIDLLKLHGIEYVVDLRSVPWSRYRPEFSQDQLAATLRSHGIVYVFMGEELGGRPDDPTCYDREGRVDYRACEERAPFQRGITRLHGAWQEGRGLALMCSEERPESCHRAKLVAPALEAAGAEVVHLDEQGELRTQSEVVDRIQGPQTTLLDEPHLLTKSRNRYRPAA
jgi:uncharacterized protein (DUF488 family)